MMSMEEEMSSTISNGESNVVAELSDSNSNLSVSNKRKRQEKNTTSSSSGRFKGVVLQPNGHWGAQIYGTQQRNWLGTFKSEEEAAMAYDSAAMKLQIRDPQRNYPLSSEHEHDFQALHTKEDVLNMIKDGSYQSKFQDFLRARPIEVGLLADANTMSRGSVVNDRGFPRQQLFQKELTPSDVGTLNRIVIPKKYAVKYFPDVKGDKVPHSQIVVIFDKHMKQWSFRYSYWKSSQSFVLTKGWYEFVKDKKLKAKEVITFYSFEYREPGKPLQSCCMIDVDKEDDETKNGGFVGGFDESTRRRLDLELGNGRSTIGAKRDRCGSRKKSKEEETLVMEVEPPPPQPVAPSSSADEKKGFRLFGVFIDIDEVSTPNVF